MTRSAWLWTAVLLGLTACAPLFLLPERFGTGAGAAALGVACLPFVVSGLRNGRVLPASPLVPPVLGLLALLPLGVWASPLRESVTLPQINLLVWSALIFGVVLWLGAPTADDQGVTRRFWLLTLFLLWGAAFALPALANMRTVPKIPVIADWLTRIWGPELFDAADNPDGFHPNRVGGLLAVLLPTAAALSWAAVRGVPLPAPRLGRPLRLLWRVAVPLLTLCCAAALLITQSRAAWVAVAVAVAAMLLWSGWWGRLLVLIGSVGSVALLLLTGWWAILYDAWVLWPYSTSGWRLAIWPRAWQAIRDFPLSGIGFGTFGDLLLGLYFWEPPGKTPADAVIVAGLTHAHNLFLQTALDLGVVGLALLIWLLVGAALSAERAARLGRRGSFERFAAVGLWGSLLAFLVFNLPDALTLGSRPGVFFWWLLALIGATAADLPPARPALRRALHPAGWLAATGVLVGVAAWQSGRLNVHLTPAVAAWAKGQPAQQTAAAADLDALSAVDCRAAYYAGLLYDRLGATAERQAARRTAVACTPGAAQLLAAVAPRDLELAAQAVAAHPQLATAHFWQGRALSAAGQTAEATAAYRRGLLIDPRDGLVWAELGKLLEAQAPEQAIAAYLRACQYGEPIVGGCRDAGRLALALGEPARAADYFRQSHRPSVRRMADDVQRSIKQPGARPTPANGESSPKK